MSNVRRHMNPDWLVYENAAKAAIEHLREKFGLTRVEGKQLLNGKTGVAWEVDAKAWCDGSDRFLVVEARRRTTSRLKQGDVAAIAFSIEDVGASGGIVVSPLPLQEGAKTLAASKNIEHLRLSSESTPELYLAEYMGLRYRGLTYGDSMSIGVPTLLGGELRSASDDA